MDNENVRPSVARLLEKYPPPPPTTTTTTTPSTYSQSLQFNNARGFDAHNNNIPPTPTTTSLMTIMSVHDAFDALVGDDAKDRPLPSLALIMGVKEEEEETEEHVKKEDQKENEHAYPLIEGEEEEVLFGSFEDVPPTTTSSISLCVPPKTNINHVNNDPDHDLNNDQVVAVDAINTVHGLCSNRAEEDEKDKFDGDGQYCKIIEDKDRINEIMKKNTALHNIDNDEDLAVVDSVLVRDNVVVVVVDHEDNIVNCDCEEDDNLDDFGEFEVASPLPSSEVADVIVAEESGLVQDGNDDNTMLTKTSMAVLPDGESKEYNLHSNLDPILSIQEEIPSTAKDKDIVVVEESNTTTTTDKSGSKHDNLSSAFDGLLDVEDAPLPPLESFYSTTIGAESGGGALQGKVMDVDVENDEFCEFEDASTAAATEEVTNRGEDINVSWQCNAPGTKKKDRQLPGAALFDGGLFANCESDTTPNGVSSVFESFGGALDAPLPNLDPILPPVSVGESVSDNVAETLGDDMKVVDDFGDFDFSNTVVNRECDIASNGVISVFDAFGEAPDVPLSTSDRTFPPISAGERDIDNATVGFCDEVRNDDDSFGDFDGVIENCNVDDCYVGDANLIAKDSLFYPLAEPKDTLQTNGVPSTTDISNIFYGREENTLSREFGNVMKREIPSFTDDQFGDHPQETDFSAKLDREGGSRWNGNEAFDESELAPAIGEDMLYMVEDRIDFHHAASKNEEDDVCEQGTSLDVEMEGHHDEEERFGQFDDCHEAEIHGCAEELPAYSDTSFSECKKENETSAIDSVPAINYDANSIQPEAPGVTYGGENVGDFSQFESHLNEEKNLRNMEVCAHAEEVQSSYPFQAVDSYLNLEKSDNPDDCDGFGNFTSFEDANHQTADTKSDLEKIICKELGHECNQLVGWWKGIMSAVENDLREGSALLNRLAAKISAADRAGIIKSVKLCEFIRGLAELVRVVRSIVASIGELLGVGKNIEVHESTLSQWNDEAIVADAIVIEFLWSQIISRAVALGIISQAPQLETVIEIRSLNSFNASQKADVCQLTLRPLIEVSCTKTSVSWNGKKYMACAANFCANRMPELSLKI